MFERQHNLPPIYDAFVGYGALKRRIHVSLDGRKRRCITLVGMGGVGKTRLATTVARERLGYYSDGVWMVTFANTRVEATRSISVSNVSDAVATLIAGALGMPWQGSGSPSVEVFRYLQGRSALLILDAFEEWMDDGGEFLRRLLRRCPKVQLLVTSRYLPAILAGPTLTLYGLSYPADVADERPCESVRLLRARWTQHHGVPPPPEEEHALRRICRRVEGLPLAVELAGLCSREETAASIAQRLQEGFHPLPSPLRDTPPRHRSLQALFEGAWQPLSLELQRSLLRLTPLPGPFTTDQARRQARVTLQRLIALRNRSWLQFDASTHQWRWHSLAHAFVVTLA